MEKDKEIGRMISDKSYGYTVLLHKKLEKMLINFNLKIKNTLFKSK